MTVVRSAAAALVVAGLMSVSTACGGTASAGGAPAAGEKAATAVVGSGWKEPSAYTYTLESSGGERMLIDRFRVTVRGGEAVKAAGLDDSGRRVVRQAPDAVPTIGELLEELAGGPPRQGGLGGGDVHGRRAFDADLAGLGGERHRRRGPVCGQ